MNADTLPGMAGPGFAMAHGTTTGDGIDRSARLSEDGVYRYTLSRHWEQPAWLTAAAETGKPFGQVLAFVMLNPSTADGRVDDRTIGRCMSFARRESYAGIVVVNLYALRLTNPAGLLDHPDPVGPDNDIHLRMLLTERARRRLPTIAAWGAHKGIGARVDAVRALVPETDWRCLGRTAGGAPRHPLYVRGDQPLNSFEVSW